MFFQNTTTLRLWGDQKEPHRILYGCSVSSSSFQNTHTKSSRRIYAWCLRLLPSQNILPLLGWCLRLPSLDTSKSKETVAMCAPSARTPLQSFLWVCGLSSPLQHSQGQRLKLSATICMAAAFSSRSKRNVGATAVWCSPTLPEGFQKGKALGLCVWLAEIPPRGLQCLLCLSSPRTSLRSGNQNMA